MAEGRTTSGSVGGLVWSVAEDGLSLTAMVEDPERVSTTAEEVLRHLTQNGIQSEIDMNALKELLSGEKKGEAVIARGAPPKPPVEGKLEFYVDPASLDRTPVEDVTGRVDYKNLKMFQSVNKGDPIVRKKDAIPGEPGVDVFGKTIPPREPKPLFLPVADGVEIKEDGYLGVAAMDGAVTKIRDRLGVMEIFFIRGDVSYKSGNVDFNGSVDIAKDVLAGFEVKATGDIVIRGIVESAYLEAGGDITVFGGIQGAGKGKIKAGGTVRIRFANDCQIEAGKEIIIQSQVVNCELRAGEAVHMEGNKGVITGGSTIAGERVSCANLGSKLGVSTLVQIGLDTELLEKINAAQDIVAAASKVGMKNESRSGELTRMKEDLKRALEGEVEVRGAVYPGVIVQFPGASFEVHDSIQSAVFYTERWKVLTKPLK